MANATIRWSGAAAVAAVRVGMAEGLNQAAEYLAGQSTPLVPYLDGDLTDSQDIHQATPATVEEGAQVQYDTPYAVAQHEGSSTYTRGDRTITAVYVNYTHNPHPNAGSHFLSRPLQSNAATLQQIIAASVNRSLS